MRLIVIVLAAYLMASCSPKNKRALIVVDMQNCFVEGPDKSAHSLPVKEGRDIVPGINDLMEKFELVVATQDWHPAEHVSFASNHPGKKNFEQIKLPSGHDQTLWPDHCVIGTKGANWIEGINAKAFDKVVRKGSDKNVDSYSGFFDNAKGGQTELADYLKKNDIKEVYVVGLAADYCVKFTALDGEELGFDTFFVKDLTKAVDPSGLEKNLSELQSSGVQIIQSSSID